MVSWGGHWIFMLLKWWHFCYVHKGRAVKKPQNLSTWFMDCPKVSHYHPLKPRNCGAILATKELPFFTEVELRFALKDLLFTKWKTEIQNKILQGPPPQTLQFQKLIFHLLNNFLVFKIRFHILQIWQFYDKHQKIIEKKEK